MNPPSTNPRYTTSKELPVLTERQLRMCMAAQEGLNYLAEEIYTMAKEELEACNNGKDQNQARIRGQSGALKKIIQDCPTGKREIAKLLHTMHKSVIEATILGTIAHRSKGDLKNCFFPSDECAGAYIITFCVNGSTKGLTKGEWKDVQDMIRTYGAGEGVKVNNRSTTAEQAAAARASQIDSIIRCRNENPAHILENSRNGYREMAFQELDMFCEMLEDRMSANDPTGDTRQIQIPMQVGCSMDIAGRLAKYDPIEDLKQSAKPWALLISCLKVMGYHVDFVGLPIIKIWKACQLELAEILLTFLGGSLMCHGGLNSMAAGTKTGTEDQDKFDIASRQIYLNAEWAKQNLEESEQILNRRKEVLSLYRHIPVIDSIPTQLEKLRDRMTLFTQVLSDTTRALEDHYQEGEIANKEMSSKLTSMIAEAAFGKMVIEAWNGRKGAGDIDGGNSNGDKSDG